MLCVVNVSLETVTSDVELLPAFERIDRSVQP